MYTYFMGAGASSTKKSDPITLYFYVKNDNTIDLLSNAQILPTLIYKIDDTYDFVSTTVPLIEYQTSSLISKISTIFKGKTIYLIPTTSKIGVVTKENSIIGCTLSKTRNLTPGTLWSTLFCGMC